jgi:hypothetical protein
MSFRIIAAQGVEWTVWSVAPGNPDLVAEDMRTGWLCFESAHEKRRLAPIPATWQEAPDEELLELLDEAKVTTPRNWPTAQRRE